MTTQLREPIFTKNFMFISLSNFFLFFTFYALLTSLPIYVLDDLKGTEAQAGLVVTIFLLSAIIVRPFSGILLERFGKKKMLVFSLIMFMLASILYLFVGNLYLLLGLRFFHGIWFSIATTATGAIAADVIPTNRSGEGLGYFLLSTNIAVVAGPFIGLTLLQTITFQSLFIILSVVGIGAIIFSSLMKVAKVDPIRAKKKITISDLFEKKSLPVSFIASLLAFAYSSILAFISIFTKSLGLLEAASYFFVVFAISMLLTRPFVGRLFDRKGPNIVIYPSIIMFSIGLFILSITNSAFELLTAAAFLGIGYGSLVPCLQTLALQYAGRGRSGHGTATFFTLFDTGIAAGSYVLGLVVSHLGYEPLYLYLSIFVLAMIPCYKFLKIGSPRVKPNEYDNK